MALSTFTAWIAAGCGGGGFQTVAHNEGDVPVILRADDGPLSRFYALGPGTSVVVDDTGEANPAADAIVVLTTECEVIADVGADYWKGGRITVGPALAISFEAGRDPRPALPRFLAGPDELTAAEGSCEAAAAAVVVRPS